MENYNIKIAQNKCFISILGQGTMALCTALSSSTFDVLICLGVPWFIKAMWFHKENSSASINIHSKSLDDSAIAVMLSTIGFMLLMCAKSFVLTKRVCIIFIFTYDLYLNNFRYVKKLKTMLVLVVLRGMKLLLFLKIFVRTFSNYIITIYQCHNHIKYFNILVRTVFLLFYKYIQFFSQIKHW